MRWTWTVQLPCCQRSGRTRTPPAPAARLHSSLRLALQPKEPQAAPPQDQRAKKPDRPRNPPLQPHPSWRTYLLRSRCCQKIIPPHLNPRAAPQPHPRQSLSGKKPKWEPPLCDTLQRLACITAQVLSVTTKGTLLLQSQSIGGGGANTIHTAPS